MKELKRVNDSTLPALQSSFFCNLLHSLHYNLAVLCYESQMMGMCLANIAVIIKIHLKYVWYKINHYKSCDFSTICLLDTKKVFPSLAHHLSRRLKRDFLIKICPLSVVLVVENFSHFHLLLKNHWANFNQSWHKASLGGVKFVQTKGFVHPFPRGDNY